MVINLLVKTAFNFAPAELLHSNGLEYNSNDVSPILHSTCDYDTTQLCFGESEASTYLVVLFPSEAESGIAQTDYLAPLSHVGHQRR